MVEPEHALEKARVDRPKEGGQHRFGKAAPAGIQKRILPALAPLERETPPVGGFDLGGQTQIGVIVLEVVGRPGFDSEEQVAQRPQRCRLAGFVVAADEMEIRRIAKFQSAIGEVAKPVEAKPEQSHRSNSWSSSRDRTMALASPIRAAGSRRTVNPLPGSSASSSRGSLAISSSSSDWRVACRSGSVARLSSERSRLPTASWRRLRAMRSRTGRVAVTIFSIQTASTARSRATARTSA